MSSLIVPARAAHVGRMSTAAAASAACLATCSPSTRCAHPRHAGRTSYKQLGCSGSACLAFGTVRQDKIAWHGIGSLWNEEDCVIPRNQTAVITYQPYSSALNWVLPAKPL